MYSRDFAAVREPSSVSFIFRSRAHAFYIHFIIFIIWGENFTRDVFEIKIRLFAKRDENTTSSSARAARIDFIYSREKKLYKNKRIAADGNREPIKSKL